MEFEVSDKVADYGVKPLIQKGYYPLQFLSIKEFADAKGKPILGTYGYQVIMQFAVFDKDGRGAPTAPMMYEYTNDAGEKKSEKVVISKFVYHMYKNDDGTLRTAFTLKSAITKISEALGWKFDASKKVNLADYFGNWVEGNINDYTNKKTGETMSSIQGIERYTGPTVGDEVSSSSPEPKREPMVVKKQIKHNQVSNPAVENVTEKLEITSEDNEEVKNVKQKINNIQEMHDSGVLEEKPYNTAMKNLNEELEAARKK